MTETTTYPLLDGFTIPKIGFGTYQLNGASGVQAILSGIQQGYRLIDTAFNYENEGTVGTALKRTSVPRDQLTITSKLPGRHHKYAEALDSIQESIYRLGVDYLDLHLIHWPNPKEDLYVEAWQAMIDAQRWGWIRSIGVCNFLPEHIDRLEKETGILPVVNQIELHPFFNQAEQRAYHQEKGILTESWSPLGRASNVLTNDFLQELANRYHKSVAQIILRWHYQLGAIAIPKSSSAARQAANIDLFDFTLTEQEIAKINQLTKLDGRINDQDPAVYQEF